MSVKPLIIIIVILILLSLSSSLFFLFKDQGAGKRSVYSLGIRVSLAAMLLILVTYGLTQGSLEILSLGDLSLKYINKKK